MFLCLTQWQDNKFLQSVAREFYVGLLTLPVTGVIDPQIHISQPSNEKIYIMS